MKTDRSRKNEPARLKMGAPHTKPYMTSRAGRAFERASYADLSIGSLLVLVLSSTYFALAPPDHGILHQGNFVSRVFNSVYFSVVTFTSLGYGDFLPRGIGKIVACASVLLGLALVALFIGKLASERTQATLFLLHTSDRERRLQAFAEQIALAADGLRSSCASKPASELRHAVRELSIILETASNYIVFHGHHSRLGDYGNAPALYRLLAELKAALDPIFAAVFCPAADAAVYERLQGVLSRVERTFDLILAMQTKQELDWTSALLVRMGLKERPVLEVSRGQMRLHAALEQEINQGRKKLASQVSSGQLERVLLACLVGPLAKWPKHEHKRIAVELQISHNLAQRCLTRLIEQERLPKLDRSGPVSNT